MAIAAMLIRRLPLSTAMIYLPVDLFVMRKWT